MKWKTKPEPKQGERREFYGFAFLPIRIENEFRWLEDVRFIAQWSNSLGCWIKVKWLP